MADAVYAKVAGGPGQFAQGQQVEMGSGLHYAVGVDAAARKRAAMGREVLQFHYAPLFAGAGQPPDHLAHALGAAGKNEAALAP